MKYNSTARAEESTTCSCCAILTEENGSPKVAVNCDYPASSLKNKLGISAFHCHCEMRFSDPSEVGEKVIAEVAGALKEITVGKIDKETLEMENLISQ